MNHKYKKNKFFLHDHTNTKKHTQIYLFAHEMMQAKHILTYKTTHKY